eukprot:m.17344 g.17344  ORF g.17344 m.17344 type:complete len:176 (+) comp5441_c0_seq2:92-619(+)
MPGGAVADEECVGRCECCCSLEAELTTVFRQSDVTSKGFLDDEDLSMAWLSVLGYVPSEYELRHFVSAAPRGQAMDLATFVGLMQQQLTAQGEDEDIRHIFQAFDATAKGFIAISDLEAVCREFGLAPSTAAEVFREADRDGDGRVSYRDFEALMKLRPAVKATATAAAQNPFRN